MFRRHVDKATVTPKILLPQFVVDKLNVEIVVA